MVIRAKKIFIAIMIISFLIFSGGSVYAATLKSKCRTQYPLPILMYHHFSNDPGKLGKYVISPSEFENDIKCILKNGYTPINVLDLINYTQRGVPLPKKPIMITIDDGYYSFYKLIFPIIKKYKIKTVLSVLGYYSELYSNLCENHIDYSHVTFCQISEMADSAFIEIQNHSYNLHSLTDRYGVKAKDGECDEEYEKTVSGDIEKMQKLLYDNCKIKATAFTYPFGYYCDSSEDLIRSLGFKASFICEEKINTVTRDKSSLYKLGRYNRAHGINFDELILKISQE